MQFVIQVKRSQPGTERVHLLHFHMQFLVGYFICGGLDWTKIKCALLLPQGGFSTYHATQKAQFSSEYEPLPQEAGVSACDAQDMPAGHGVHEIWPAVE